MKKKENKKKEAIKWLVSFAVIGVLLITGWHRPLIAQVQKIVLATGLLQADLPADDAAKSKSGLTFSMIDEAGRPVELRDFKGKAIFLNFWATWCPPCKAEMPGIQNLYEETKNGNVQFVMISTDKDFEKAKTFKESNGYTFPVYRLNSHIPEEFVGRSIPRTYVLDGEGSIRLKHTGMAQYDSDEFVAFFKDIMN